MTKFEKFLIEKGYRKYTKKYTKKSWKYDLESLTIHELTTMGNSDHRYFHESDQDMKNEIVFGLNESHRPAILTYPRPRIIIKNGDLYEYIIPDYIVNRILTQFSNEEVFDSLYDNNMKFVVENDTITLVKN